MKLKLPLICVCCRPPAFVTCLCQPGAGCTLQYLETCTPLVRRPPSYMILVQNGAQMPALYSQLTPPQQTSKRQSLDQQQFQEARAATSASTSSTGNNTNSMHAAPPASSPPGTRAPSQNSAGETQDRASGRSDMSQALLFNTAALESNLAAAQRGDTTDLSGVGDTDSIDAAPRTSQAFQGSVPTRKNTASGAGHRSVLQA